MTDPIRVMIADNHPMFRKGIAALLNSLPQFELVAEAEDGAAVLSLADQHQPDVILMDIQMPKLNSIEVTRRIVLRSPHIGILMVTMYQDDDFVFKSMQAGARGYLLKGADQEEIVRAIQTVSSGGAIFSPAIASYMMTYFAAVKLTRAGDLFPELTEREIEVLDLIAKG
jgi:DNA-binding NarL/FixJ family response regulator